MSSSYPTSLGITIQMGSKAGPAYAHVMLLGETSPGKYGQVWDATIRLGGEHEVLTPREALGRLGIAMLARVDEALLA